MRGVRRTKAREIQNFTEENEIEAIENVKKGSVQVTHMNSRRKYAQLPRTKVDLVSQQRAQAGRSSQSYTVRAQPSSKQPGPGLRREKLRPTQSSYNPNATWSSLFPIFCALSSRKSLQLDLHPLVIRQN